MTATKPSSMYGRTLLSGIIVGLAGFLAVLPTNLFMQNFGVSTFTGENAVSVGLTQMLLMAPQTCLTFSASLIAAALVMRHIDATKTNATSATQHHID